jgi:hypothetical protein
MYNLTQPLKIQDLITRRGTYSSPMREKWRKKRDEMKRLYGNTPVLWSSVMSILAKSPDGKSEKELYSEVSKDFPDESRSSFHEAMEAYVHINHVTFNEKNRKYKISPRIVQPIII